MAGTEGTFQIALVGNFQINAFDHEDDNTAESGIKKEAVPLLRLMLNETAQERFGNFTVR